MQKFYETNRGDILIKFESGLHPLTVGDDLIQSILELCNEYQMDKAVLSKGRSYEVELWYRMDSIKLYWLVVSQSWSEVYLAA